MRDFKKLKCWALSHELTLEIYKVTSAFPMYEQFGLTTQMRKSSSSMSTNIAEGCGRKTNADFSRFLDLALGSTNELEYQLLLSRDLTYISNEKHDELLKKTEEVGEKQHSDIKRLYGIKFPISTHLFF